MPRRNKNKPEDNTHKGMMTPRHKSASRPKNKPSPFLSLSLSVSHIYPEINILQFSNWCNHKCNNSITPAHQIRACIRRRVRANISHPPPPLRSRRFVELRSKIVPKMRSKSPVIIDSLLISCRSQISSANKNSAIARKCLETWRG